ncbi:hypothetical protein B2J93_5766 [Marssonina coronariae]|uniref:Uncharacterized protein n=1 Tax=Diplocarpon coronariae TaxID=2795749 RepID=A0A218YYW8_9HELO|nr:hypothetical protein B2J93_5766 [Marssonina coronariae]
MMLIRSLNLLASASIITIAVANPAWTPQQAEISLSLDEVGASRQDDANLAVDEMCRRTFLPEEPNCKEPWFGWTCCRAYSHSADDLQPILKDDELVLPMDEPVGGASE